MTLERAVCGLLYGAHASWSFNTGKIMLADGAKCWAIWLGEIGTAEVENTFFAFAKGAPKAFHVKHLPPKPQEAESQDKSHFVLKRAI